VRKHLETAWEQPFHKPTLEVYQQLSQAVGFDAALPIILDSGCGTGKSTRELANMFPGHMVLGVDRSHVRLSKSGLGSGFHRIGNCVLIRAELATFWRLMLSDGHAPERHYLFYPNPYPKPGHLSRRWHGHPVFPLLLKLGGDIEMRCNWEVYALEFAQAVNQVCSAQVKVESFMAENGISLFEQKYLDRCQQLYSVKVAARITANYADTELI
jgi:tRNA (guanine-N7-)-methyltransferase